MAHFALNFLLLSGLKDLGWYVHQGHGGALYPVNISAIDASDVDCSS